MIEIDLNLDELDATSAETKATYEEIKEYVLKETGLKVSNIYLSGQAKMRTGGRRKLQSVKEQKKSLCRNAER